MAILTVETTVKANVKKVWDCWTHPKHIKNWYFASDDWYVPYADNNVCVKGLFKTTMSSKDKTMSFDLEGVYTEVQKNESIHFTLEDGRNVIVLFLENGDSTTVTESFESENQNPLEMQKQGWQAILNNFKKYVETQ